ncbi:MAG TPA: hypothetical protein VNA16_09315 [Abditibacteriaceae bacterium]|nr:hypothetical protein [Abditibacteriaceae bacterium]
MPPGKPPPEFLILGGKFAVVKDGTNSLLELPGEPVDTFGLLFGPTLKSSTQASVNVRARISGTALGRRSPAFGLGLYGVSGYKLRVSPAKAALELLKDEEVKVSIPYAWQSGSWTILRLQSRKIKGNWKIEGKAWPQGVAEPKSWMISLEDKTPPTAGRPSLWGMPYSDTPIRFDDLVLSQAQP